MRKDDKKSLKWYEQKWFLIIYFCIWCLATLIFLAVQDFAAFMFLALLSLNYISIHKNRKKAIKRIQDNQRLDILNKGIKNLSNTVMEATAPIQISEETVQTKNSRHNQVAASTQTIEDNISPVKQQKKDEQKLHFTFKVAGVTFENDKGKDIQTLLRKIGREISKENDIESYGGWSNQEIIEFGHEVSEFEDVDIGKLISFEKDPNNEFDQNAIKVIVNINNNKFHIGYISKKDRTEMAKLLKSNSIADISANFLGGKIKEVDYDSEKDKDVVVINELNLGIEITLYLKEKHKTTTDSKPKIVTSSLEEVPAGEKRKEEIKSDTYGSINDFLKYSKVRKLQSDFTVLDFETTGFSADSNKIIQVAAVKYRNFERIDQFVSFVNPQEHISSRITKINGISDDDVKSAPLIEVILPQLLQFIGDDTIIAHNASFDMKFLLTNMYKNNIKYKPYKVIDTLTLARKYIIDSENHKLPTLKQYLKLDKYKSHEALHDCFVTAELYRYCYSQSVSISTNAHS